jgi:hypothetical protein
VYRVRGSTGGAFLHYFWHKISVTKCPYLKICHLSVREACSAMPFLAVLKINDLYNIKRRIRADDDLQYILPVYILDFKQVWRTITYMA